MNKNGKYTKHTRHISRRTHLVINVKEWNFHKTLWFEGGSEPVRNFNQECKVTLIES